MLELKITITAADLSAAINNLAAALTNGNNTKHTEKTAASTASAPVAQPATPTVPVNPTPAQTATPVAHTVPVAQTVPTATPAAYPAPTPIPTSAPQYTLEMIATAGSALIDAGKMDQLMQLLAKFGVVSLTELASDNYGAVASELRALGAAI